MGMERENWDDEWAGLEPKQARSRQWGCWLGLLLLILLLLALCTAGGYLAWQQLDLTLGPGMILVPPTAMSNRPDTAEAETPEAVTTESAILAPTVTLPAAQDGEAIEVQQMTAPVIDGDLGEWEGMPSFESSYVVYSVEGWDGSDDVTAIWRLGWDSGNLYAAVRVDDDSHVQIERGNQIFRGDGVSLQIDSDRAGDFGSQLSTDDYQINLSPGDFADIVPSAYRFRGSRAGDAADAPGHSIVIAAQETGQGYTLEAAIPWQDIGVAALPGLTIGLALNVNDNDTPGTAVQEVMKSHVATRTLRDPSSWGELILR